MKREKWSKNFSEWLDEVLQNAGIFDYGRYPMKGVGAFMPYGMKLRRLVTDLIRRLLDESGHDEVLLPMLIPKHLLAKESEHIKGFESEVYWVTKGGTVDLDVPLALRPTSETIISYFESMWIKSYKQLPARYYQIGSIFRYETKATRPLIRLREVMTFKEAHTAHESFEDADKQCKEAIEIYKRIYDELGIPYMISVRPPWDKFAGALYTVAFDTIMPDGRTLQIGTVHHLGQNFSIPFEIRFQRRDEVMDLVWQTSYGISDRILAVLIAVHGDDLGPIFPPKVAPIQVVIVPIPGEGVLEYAKEIEDELRKKGWRVKLDDREDLTPGKKFYDWESKGVPLRIEVGKKEVSEATVTIARRDTRERTKVRKEEMDKALRDVAKAMEEDMRKRAWDWMRSRIKRAESLEEAKRLVEQRYVVEVPWCGSNECGLRLKEEVGQVLGFPLDKDYRADGKCVVCGSRARAWLRISKSY